MWITDAASDIEITYAIGPYPGETEPLHTWTATLHGTPIAALYADLATGQIMQVETDMPYRRLGIATALYRAAAAQTAIRHSPAEHRTGEGDGWASAVGGDTIDPVLAYQP